MNIAIILPILYGGGSERVSSILSKGFSNLGHCVYLIATSKQTKEPSYNFDNRVSITLLNETGKVTRLQKIHLLRQFFKEKNIQVAISFANGTALISKLASIFTKTKSVYYVNSDPRDKDNGIFQRLLFITSICSSNNVVFQSEKLRLTYSKRIQKKSIALPNPLNVKSMPSQCLHKNIFSFMTAGRLVDVKNHDFMIRSFCLFHKKYPASFLNVFGSGPNLKKLTRIIKETASESFIRIIPYTNEIFREMLQHSVFLLTSKHEGMPNVVLESQALGLPVVAINCPIGAIEELVDSQKSGILLSPKSSYEQFAKAMDKLISNYDFYAENALKHADYIRDHFASEKIIQIWDAFLIQLIKHY